MLVLLVFGNRISETYGVTEILDQKNLGPSVIYLLICAQVHIDEVANMAHTVAASFEIKAIKHALAVDVNCTCLI